MWTFPNLKSSRRVKEKIKVSPSEIGATLNYSNVPEEGKAMYHGKNRPAFAFFVRK